MEYDVADMPATLSDRQKLTLEFLIDFTLTHGYQPSLAEVALEIGVSGRSGARTHFEALAKKGWIEFSGEKPRAVRIRFLPDGKPFEGLITR